MNPIEILTDESISKIEDVIKTLESYYDAFKSKTVKRQIEDLKEIIKNVKE